MVTVSDAELLEMAQALYKKLGGVRSKDARIVRALMERAGLGSQPTPRALDKCQHCNGAGVLMTAIGSKLCPRCEGSGTCQ